MFPTAIHIALAIVAAFFLWKLLQIARRTGPLAGAVITAGFLCRAFMAQILFWISYLRLPVARSLQVGDGYWFFAVDAPLYFQWAHQLMNLGWRMVLLVDKNLPSPVYLQVLALFIMFFGAVASIGILLNLLCYLATAIIISRWGRIGGDVGRPALVGLTALTFSPAILLWSSQPLKDTFFIFVVVLFVGGCALWERIWQSQNVPHWRAGMIAALAAMAIGLYAIAGIRWYFALVTWMASFVFFVLTAATSPRRRWVALVAGLFTFLGLSQPIVLGGGPYLPEKLYNVIRLKRPVAETQALPHQVERLFEATRAGFDNTPAATTIGMSRAFRKHGVHATSRVPAPIPGESEGSADVLVVPTTTSERLLTGLTAMLLPRALGEALGFIHVGGGRGLWLFVEFDTLIFDAMLFFAIFAIVRVARSGAAMTIPTLWAVSLMAILIAAPIAYTVSNFGTLFRHREMVYLAICLVPVALTRFWRPAGDRKKGEELPAGAALYG